MRNRVKRADTTHYSVRWATRKQKGKEKEFKTGKVFSTDAHINSTI